MKKTSIILLIALIAIMFTSILSGCSKLDDELKSGVYVAKERLASLDIGEDKTFILNRDLATSYDPVGHYTIDGDKLLLHVNEDVKQIIEFKIDGDTLIFESGELAEGLIKKGTEFIYKD